MRTWLIVVWIRFNAAVRSKACIAATLICAAVLLLPFLVDMPTGAAYLYDFDSVEEQSAFLDEQIASGTYDSAPDELRQLVQKEQEAYHRALAESPSYTTSYYESLTEQQETFAAESDAGYVDGEVSEHSLEAAHTLTSCISQLRTPRHYTGMGKMPGLLYLAALPGLIPFLLWFIPALVAIGAVLTKHDRSFIDQAPLSDSLSALTYAAAGFAASCAASAAMVVPALLIATALNGVGDGTYPVVFIQDGAVIQRGCLEQILTAALLFLALLLVLSCLASLALTTTQSVRAPFAILLLFIAPPAFSLYSADSMPWHAVLRFLPTTYFDFRTIAGFFSYANGADICTAPGANLVHGLIVSAVLVATAIGGHFALCSLHRYRRWGWATPTDCDAPELLALYSEGICASYAKTPILEEAHLELGRGSVSGLIAPNGYGKTTLLRLLHGSNVAKARGTLTFVAGPNPVHTYLVPDLDDACFSYLSVKRILRYSAVLFGHEKNLGYVIDALGLVPVLKKRASRCSAGNRQLVNIALGLLAQPVVLMLDEPMSALDPINVERVSTALRAASGTGTAVILSSHNLENLRELCDSFLFIKNRQIERLDRKGGAEQNLSHLFKEWYAG